jgi:hypothetical protein
MERKAIHDPMNIGSLDTGGQQRGADGDSRWSSAGLWKVSNAPTEACARFASGAASYSTVEPSASSMNGPISPATALAVSSADSAGVVT